MGFKAPSICTGAAILLAASLLQTSAQTNSTSGIAWNNITPAIGADTSGAIANLITSQGKTSGIRFQMLSRFNAADQNGSLSSKAFPANATRDSLFANTEPVNGLANLTPSFKITFTPDIFGCSFTIYASRMGATHNLQTRYTLTGATTSVADLNPANNEDQVVYVSTSPDANHAVTLTITPGSDNNHPNHLTFLGAIRIATLSDYGGPNLYFDFGSETSPTVNLPFLTLTPQPNGNAMLRLDAEGTFARLEYSSDLLIWQQLQNFSLTNGNGAMEIQLTPSNRFLRALQ
jgi:hypothetical protein